MSDVEKAYKLYEEYKRDRDKKKLEEIIKILEGREEVVSLNLLSLAYIDLGNPDKAIEAIDKALKKVKDEEDKSILLFNKALALKQKGDLNLAYDVLKQISPRSSIYTHARRFLAQICISFRDVKHLEEAREILESFEIPNEDLIVVLG